MEKKFKGIFLFLIIAILMIGALHYAQYLVPQDAETVIEGYANYTPEQAAASTSKDYGSFNDIVLKVNDFAWGIYVCVLLVGTGLFFTIRTRGFQFRKFSHVIKNTIGRIFHPSENKHTQKKGEITPFQALTTAMAATVGTGNIAGVTGAIVIGGPGAVFWMWVSALLGMMTKYAEVVLAVKFREKNSKGEWVGGPMYYIKNGLGKNWNWLAILFCILGSFAAFGIGNIAQSSSIASTLITAIESVTPNVIHGTATEAVLRWVIGGAIALIVGIVLLGGVTRIGKVTEKIVPFMSIFYIIGSLVIIFANISNIGRVFSTIFEAAFAPNAVIGGVGGFMFMTALKKGVGRGVFSNEAGLGSAPIAHASSSESNPVKQGLYGIFEVFMDTIVICTLTSLVVLMSGIVVPWGNGALADAQTTIAAFSTVFGAQASSIFIAVAMLFFAVSTILAWSLYGQRCFGYLTKGRATIVYQIVFILISFYGTTADITVIWNLSDTMNGLMAIPNLIAVLALAGTVVKLTKAYSQGLKFNQTPKKKQKIRA